MTNLFNYDGIKEWIPYISKGLGITLLIALVAAIFGVIIGMALVLMTKNPVTKRIANTYIDIFRGTPLLLQLSIIYFAIPQILDGVFNGYMGLNIDFALSGLIAAYITFSLNSGAYISEIIRSGINGVDPGEIEAAKALGVNRFYIYKDCRD